MNFTHQEWCTGPSESAKRGQIGVLPERLQLDVPDGRDFVFEGKFPGVQLEDAHPVQNLVHQLDSLVFLCHLCNLKW